MHHDAGTLHADNTVKIVPPRRLVTFFVYLNGTPSGGSIRDLVLGACCSLYLSVCFAAVIAVGCTEFPRASPPLSVQPKRGLAVLWLNVDPLAPADADPRVVHQANPVTGDVRKFGMNIWVRDKSAAARG